MRGYLHFIIGIAFILIAGGCAGEVTNEVPSRNPDLISIARENGFTVSPVSRNEKSYLKRVIPESSILRSIVILKKESDLGSDIDRVASAYWFRSTHADILMKTLTSQMFDLLSANVENLIDEDLHREGYATIDMLAFNDPALSEERIIFVQIRDELYEFHTLVDKEELVMGLVLEVAYKRDI
jgi:hypothetical protein